MRQIAIKGVLDREKDNKLGHLTWCLVFLSIIIIFLRFNLKKIDNDHSYKHWIN